MRETKAARKKPAKKKIKKPVAEIIPAPQEPGFVPRSGIDLIGLLIIAAVVTLCALALVGLL